jgi:hypothetical protein
VDRRFWVPDGRRAEFDSAFSFGGAWTRFLFGAEGYLFTEVWCEVPEIRQYRVKDSWIGHRDFELFRDRMQAEFEKFEAWIRAEGFIEKEQFLGAYYEKLDDGSDDDLGLS